jgi:hypothetical protein
MFWVNRQAIHVMKTEPECNRPVLEPGTTGRFRSWSIESHISTGTVVITAHGRISCEDAKRQAAQASQLMRQHKSNRVLADFSAAIVEISLAEIYWIPGHYTTLTANRQFKIAVVAPVSGHRIGSFKFYEAHCTNAGYNVKLFAERTAAEQWLAQASVT